MRLLYLRKGNALGANYIDILMNTCVAMADRTTVHCVRWSMLLLSKKKLLIPDDTMIFLIIPALC